MKITVTRADISNGIPENDRFCPIAQALRRLGASDIRVYDATFEFTLKENLYERDLPAKARKFIALFDKNKPVKPFCFTLPKL